MELPDLPFLSAAGTCISRLTSASPPPVPLQLFCHFAFAMRILFQPQTLGCNMVFDIYTRQACQKDDARNTQYLDFNSLFGYTSSIILYNCELACR